MPSDFSRDAIAAALLKSKLRTGDPDCRAGGDVVETGDRARRRPRLHRLRRDAVQFTAHERRRDRGPVVGLTEVLRWQITVYASVTIDEESSRSA
jgi:hypothetical protein